MVSPSLFLQLVLSGLVIGTIYCLMAIGITFIFSVMKMINWAMGEFYMVGSYLQWFILSFILNFEVSGLWFLSLLMTILIVFILGNVIFSVSLKQMFRVEKKMEYGTIVTLGLSILLQNTATVFAGASVFSPPEYYEATNFFNLPISGGRFVALLAAMFLIAIFYIGVRKTWTGKALQATAQSRVGAQCDGIDVRKMDRTAFGIGTALAAAAGALLAPIFLVYPTNGRLSTMKGFEIIVLGGLGSIKGAVVGGILLGLIESVASVLLSPAYRNLYGFIVMIFILVVRPTGLFGEKERKA